MREIQKWGIALLAILPDSLWQLNHSIFFGGAIRTPFFMRGIRLAIPASCFFVFKRRRSCPRLVLYNLKIKRFIKGRFNSLYY